MSWTGIYLDLSQFRLGGQEIKKPADQARQYYERLRALIKKKEKEEAEFNGPVQPSPQMRRGNDHMEEMKEHEEVVF